MWLHTKHTPVGIHPRTRPSALLLLLANTKCAHPPFPAPPPAALLRLPAPAARAPPRRPAAAPPVGGGGLGALQRLPQHGCHGDLHNRIPCMARATVRSRRRDESNGWGRTSAYWLQRHPCGFDVATVHAIAVCGRAKAERSTGTCRSPCRKPCQPRERPTASSALQAATAGALQPPNAQLATRQPPTADRHLPSYASCLGHRSGSSP